jgi:hypothetical protein
MGEAGAALGAATLQYGAAGAASHALHETVFVSAVPFLWLVCSLWHLITYIYFRLQTECSIPTDVPAICPSLSLATIKLTMFSPIIQGFSTD